MRRFTRLSILIIVMCLFTGCRRVDKSKELRIDIGDSTKFTKEEIKSAMNTVEESFNFPAASLTRLYYDEVTSDNLIIPYLEAVKDTNNNLDKINNLEDKDVIVILSDFYVDDSGDNPVLNADYTYTNYQWILIRDNNNIWTICNQGY